MRFRLRGLVSSRAPICRPRLARLVRILAFGALGAGPLGLAGCATQNAPNYAGVHEAAPQRVAERQWKVEIEDDGRPAQAPPVRRMRPEEDDPSQPWSPNYGKPPSAWQKPGQPAKEQTARPQPIDASLQTATTERPTKTSRVLNSAEADSVILHAIQNHEVRRP